MRIYKFVRIYQISQPGVFKQRRDKISSLLSIASHVFIFAMGCSMCTVALDFQVTSDVVCRTCSTSFPCWIKYEDNTHGSVNKFNILKIHT